MERECNAGELAEATGLRQPTTSQHLKVLRDADLVTVRTDGNKRLYRVNFERAVAVRDFLDSFWSSGLDRLQRTAERKKRGKRGAR